MDGKPTSQDFESSELLNGNSIGLANSPAVFAFPACVPSPVGTVVIDVCHQGPTTVLLGFATEPYEGGFWGDL